MIGVSVRMLVDTKMSTSSEIGQHILLAMYESEMELWLRQKQLLNLVDLSLKLYFVINGS